MRVVLTSWAPFVGGAEVAVERLALGLRQAGHRVLLVVGTDGDALARFRDAGVRCTFVRQQFTDKRKWLSYRRSRSALVNVLREEAPDIVHSNDLPSHQMTADAARRLSLPTVCHHRWLFEGKAIDWLNKYGADQHLFVSRALLDYLTDRSSRLRESQTDVVYDGLELPNSPEETARKACREKLEIPPNRKLVLFAGQIIERKGVADLLHGWASLKDSTRQDAMLAVIGDDLENDGEYRRKMEKLAAELNSSATFYGFQDDVGSWLTAADVVVVPSHAEPLGNATLEAMSYARPVIGTRVGGIPEMIDHEATGLLVAPHNPDELGAAMAKLLQDSTLRKQMGEQARVACEERFSLAVHVENVVSHYRQVIDRLAAGNTSRVEVGTWRRLLGLGGSATTSRSNDAANNGERCVQPKCAGPAS